MDISKWREGLSVEMDLRDEANARFLFGEEGPRIASEAREDAARPHRPVRLEVADIDYETKTVTFREVPDVDQYTT